MRLFSAATLYPTYQRRLKRLLRDADARSFDEAMAVFLNDRFGATHFLKPILEGHEDAFLALGKELDIQRKWATENGLGKFRKWDEILLAQIEHHRTEVFYSHDPNVFDDNFLKRLPGCVRKTIGWRAAPNRQVNFLGYDLLVNNFPSLLEEYRQAGTRAEYFFPAYDPLMAEYAKPWTERSADIVFTGGYSRHHLRRSEMLQAIAALADAADVRLHLDISRMTRLAESPLGSILGLKHLQRPNAVRAVARGPVFGRDLYRALGDAKIVINGAVDMIGNGRGNMRCWEALGCGALMLSDEGDYPEHFSQETMVCYEKERDAPSLARKMLKDPKHAAETASAGHAMIAAEYSKQRQWERFMELV